MADLTITLIQTSLHWEDIDANLRMLDEKIGRITGRTEVVILPEMFTTGFSMHPEKLAQDMNGSAVTWMQEKAKEKNIILTGSLIIRENGHYYNRLIWMLPNGQCGVYDKRHLFAYGEEHEHYTAGGKRLIASVKGWKVCLNVCYDLRFPVWSRNIPTGAPAEAGGVPAYDLLIYVANWPEARILAWDTLLQARAIENQAFVAGVNRLGKDGNGIPHSGDSSVIDPMGRIIYRKKKEEDIFTCTLSESALKETRSRFPFLEDADPFIMI